MTSTRTRKILIAVLVGLVLLMPIRVDAAVIYPVGQSVTLAWDDEQTDIDHYEVVLIRNVSGVEYGPYVTTTKTIVIPKPKSGIYEVRVRGARNDETPLEFRYSDYCSSVGDTALLKTGVVGKWKVYFKLLGPSGPIIISQEENHVYQTEDDAVGSKS